MLSLLFQLFWLIISLLCLLPWIVGALLGDDSAKTTLYFNWATFLADLELFRVDLRDKLEGLFWKKN